jgi:hypothetical protein
MSIKVLLDDQIKKILKENPELEATGKNKFELAVAQISNIKILGGLDFDDMIDGILGNGGDEGIDLCYLFHDGFIVNESDFEINSSTNFVLKIFQAKNENGFSSNGFRATKEGIEEMFNFDLGLEELDKLGANGDFISKVELIRNNYRLAKLAMASFKIEVYYVTVADNIDISTKIELYEKELLNNSLQIPIKFEYWGAQTLLDLITKTDEILEIEYEGQPLNVSERDSNTSGFAGFVSGNSLINSLLDENQRFRSELTEGNVRFFLGENKEINSSIIDTAKDSVKASNFWAMNNGITIIAENIEPASARTYILTNPQIVNGCQTVHCLYSAFKGDSSLPVNLKVFTKIVKSIDINTQTDIISATNSQNPVKAASLKANDNIQRNIESHLKPDVFYERRENYYKKQGISGLKVISLFRMAQIIHSIVNKQAVLAVNDTATLFDTDAKYRSIFNEKADFDIYRFGSLLYLKVWSLKNSDIRANNYSADKKDLISKGGFLMLHIISSFILSDSEFKINGKMVKENLTGKITIEIPIRKNFFSLRKESTFKLLNNEGIMSGYYEKAKEIIELAAEEFANRTGKTKVALFKNRSFDIDYLRPQIEKYLRT